MNSLLAVGVAIRGRATILLPKPVSFEMALSILSDILHLHGYQALLGNGVLSIHAIKAGTASQPVQDQSATRKAHPANRPTDVENLLRQQRVQEPDSK
jgi:hypothetical protein